MSDLTPEQHVTAAEEWLKVAEQAFRNGDPADASAAAGIAQGHAALVGGDLTDVSYSARFSTAGDLPPDRNPRRPAPA